MSETTVTTTACAECLQHSHEITRLGAWIQNYVADRPGKRTFEMLELPIGELKDLVAPKRRDEEPDQVDWETKLAEADVTAICRHDSSYPRQLLDLSAPPKVLFCRGDTDLLTNRYSLVAIVGARKATGYGLEAAATISRDLTTGGYTVVSGMALGIDGAAHRGALEQGKTIAVLACGPDRPYPANHTRLYRQIVERGLIVSEHEPGADAWRWSFPARNRIIAALSSGTIVTEAAWRSGSLVTARLASELGRNVYAVPGPITAGAAAGTNDLIKDGTAQLITQASDIFTGSTEGGQRS